MDKCKIILVFIGVVYQGGKKFYSYHRTNNSNKLLDGKLYKTKMGYAPGDIIEVESIDENGTTVYPSTWKKTGIWGDKAAVDDWNITSRANEDNHLYTEKSKKESLNNLPWHRLSPFKKAMQFCDCQTRSVIIARILKEVL